MSFSPIDNSLDLPALDRKVQEFWKQNKIFKKSESLNAAQKKYYVFYDGPPGTNGKPHIGHIMQSSLKDVWPRFKTMQGFTVLRKAGWDTHGLPVELTAEQELGITGKPDIEKYGVGKFIEYCRATVLRYRDDWVQAINKLGRFLDVEDDYLTMSNDFIQSDWWVIKQAFNKKLLYQDYKILPYCCRCGTGLSSHEVAQGYQDITDLTITAKFELVNEPLTYVLAWTTTPWTLLGNVALTVGAEIEYAKVKVTNSNGKTEHLILAKETLERNQKGLGKDYTIVETIKGSRLVGLKYKPLWDFSVPAKLDSKTKIHEIVADDYVTTEDGTGVVHLALYGEDDFRLIKKFGFAQNQHVGADGKCGPNCGPYAGRFFRAEGMDVDIVKDLAARGLLFDKYRYEHSYPHCWRCKTPLMYFAKSSWFLKTTAFRNTMLAENEKINWQPPHIKQGRFGNWLENNVDWAISRERFWGSPLPIWVSEKDSQDQICIESVKELQSLGAYFEKTSQPITPEIDLHIHVLDDVVIKGKSGQIYRRAKGVLDCWFNAGVMPWGQFGYPAKPGSEELLTHQFPADFICEAIDQTRGWFYTLLAASCLVTGKSSFKNVICTELILDASGKKMSKSLGNVVDPIPLIDQFGADAVRWTFFDSNPWQVKRFSPDLPKEAIRAVFIPLWNCYSFLITYAALDGWTPAKRASGTSPIELDRWILSAQRTLILEVTSALERYDIAPAAKAISHFIEALTNWYIRRSRRRFWKSENDSDKQYAYTTLYDVLVTLAKVIAPLSPFISESMYQNLVRGFDKTAAESIHLCPWPQAAGLCEEPALEEEIDAIQEAAALGRALRVENDLKVRQPLPRLMLTPAKPQIASRLKRHVESLAEELNVKEVVFVDDSAAFVRRSVKPNWKALGPRFGEKVKALSELINTLTDDQVRLLASGNSINLNLAGEILEILPADVFLEQKAEPGFVARSGVSVTVALETKLTPELIQEGHAREIVSVIQKQRKTANFQISDKVVLEFWGDSELETALTGYKEYISRECLANSVQYMGPVPNGTKADSSISINGHPAKIELRVAK